jgi:hypothetical protein
VRPGGRDNAWSTSCGWPSPQAGAGARRTAEASAWDAMSSCPVRVRKAAARRAAVFRTRLSSGEKAARKRMATLGVVYDAVPAPRRPHDVIAVPGGRCGHRPPRPGPHATGKWLCGSVIADPDQVITLVFDQAEARAHPRPGLGGAGRRRPPSA